MPETASRPSSPSTDPVVGEPVIHLVTVGTSLSTSRDEAMKGIFKQAQSLKQPALVVDALMALDGWKSVAQRGEVADPLPQEISYLHLTYPSDCRPSGDSLVLLASDSELGKLCASIIADYARSRFHFASVTTPCLTGLDPSNNRLEDQALDLLALAVEEALQKTSRVVLNISGGFKGLIPYAALLAAIYPQVELRYLYETAKSVTTLSALPVSFDAAAWRDWRALIRSVEKMPVGEPRKSLIAALPENLRPLFNPDGGLGFLGRTLQHRFQRERTERLNIHGQGDQLLALLTGEHRLKAEEQLPQWRFSTLGDKVPEMVDHGRGHLQRVQELLAQILIPLHHASPDFFTQEEYLALNAALWLHDSGHSAEYLRLPLPAPFESLCQVPQPVSLPCSGFPSISRDLHQLLIGCLLLDEETRSAYLREPSFWNAERVAALLWVCFYHRRSMPLTEDSKPFNFGPLRVQTPCPETCVVGGEPVRVRLLSALYSLCDGCDTQAERAATDEELLARRHGLRRSVEALLNQAQMAVDSETGPSEARSLLQEFLDRRRPILDFCLSGSGSISKELEDLEKRAEEIFRGFIGDSYFRGNAPPLQDALVISILDRLQFLSRQSGFYTYHRGIQAVYVVYQGMAGGRHQFRIKASGRDLTRMQEIVLGKDVQKKGGFTAELDRSGSILLQAGLEFLIDQESLELVDG